MEDSDGAWSSSETFILGSAAPGMDFVPIIMIVVIAAGVAVAFLLISQKKPGVKKEKVSTSTKKRWRFKKISLQFL
jgi:hypothetical protein